MPLAPKLTRHSLLTGCLAASASLLGLLCFTPPASTQSAKTSQELAGRFARHQLVRLDASAVARQVRGTGRLSLAGENVAFDLTLTAHDIRAVNYRAEEIGEGGVARAIEPGPVRTFRGAARGRENGRTLAGGEARFTIDEGVIEGLIITPNGHYFVEPARKYSAAASTADYVIYEESAVLSGAAVGCGVTLAEQVGDRAETLSSAALGQDTKAASSASVGAALQELRVATEADHEYVVAAGGAAPANQEILSILNQVAGLYEVELGLTLRVVYQSAWSTASDPYTTTNPSAALTELAVYWNANRGSVARDVAHMWTGKELDNATLGTAYLEALCRYVRNIRAAYGLSKRVPGAQRIAITSHEIGHNLGATHPNQQAPPVAGCDNTVMSSSVSANPQLSFCQYSRDEVQGYLSASASCLGAGTTGLSFAVSSPYDVGGTPSGVTSADFNGDGKADLATAVGNNTVSVLLGTDAGTLQPAGGNPFPVGTSPSGITASDFDGDGRQDLAVANAGSNDVSVLLGTGTGGFQAAVNYSGLFLNILTPRLVAAGDFNGNGRDDLVVVNSGQNMVVLLSNSAGGFTERPVAFLSSNTVFVRTGDFNGDGKFDLAYVETFGDVTILLGNGDGSFLLGVRFSSPLLMGTNSVTTGDFNLDGRFDVAITTFDHVGVFLNNGDGSFRREVRYIPNGVPNSLTAGDFNGDSVLDLATANINNVSTLMGKGDGSFQAVTSLEVAHDLSTITTGDFNNDGKVDLAVVDRDTETFQRVRIALGRGDSRFDLVGLSVSPLFAISTSTSTLATGDFDGDGNLDLATVNGSTNQNTSDVYVLRGDGTGSYSRAMYLAGSNPSAITASDFNGDGRQDLVVANRGGNDVSVLLSAGASGFQPAVSYPTGAAPISVAVGDFDGDGKADLAVANAGSDDMSVLLGTGTGSFQAAVSYPISGPSLLTVGDFNGDGWLDLAHGGGFVITDNKVRVMLGNGDGSFQPPLDSSVGINHGRCNAADFNGDGKLDLATTGGDAVSVRLGNGDGTFEPEVIYTIGTQLRGLTAGDFNGDGKPDLAATTRLLNIGLPGGVVNILLNTSGQSITPPSNDNFAAARVLGGPTGTIAGGTVLATKEAGEPNHAAGSNGQGGASIWYRWTAPSTGRFYFETFSSSFPTVLAFYTGSGVGALTPVAASSSVVPEYVEFNATAGTNYQIAIDGVTGDTGRTVLRWNTGMFSNDNFAFAREIRGSSGSVNGDNTGATLEPGEPLLPGASGAAGFSVWYRWTAPNTGRVAFHATPCGDTTRLLGAYTGNFLDILNLVAVNFDGYRETDDSAVCDNRTLRFNAVAGTTYRIHLQSTVGRPFTLNWNYADPPPNDNFANALVVAGKSGGVVGSNKDASKEPGEPNHAGGSGGASVWYRWTAPFSGQVTFDALGFRNLSGNTFRYLTALMAVYTGSGLNGLTPVATNSSDNKVTFNAVAGTTYQIAVDSSPSAGGGYLPGIVPLRWGPKGVPNDEFANAQVLAGAATFSPQLGSNAGATKEPGEPNHRGNQGGASVWYRWTALNNGTASFVFNNCQTCSLMAGQELVAVYTGAGVGALTETPTTADNNYTFQASRGTTYFIAVDGRNGAAGSYEFSLVSTNISSGNDTFANAQAINGSSGSAAGDNSGATKEPGEPNHANDRGGASVWYRWTAPASGIYTFDTFGSSFDTLLGVYTGEAVNTLSGLINSDNAGTSAQSRVTINAVVNTTYYIAVDGKSTGVDSSTGLPQSQTGFILLNWSDLSPPANDNFANAQILQGAAGNAAGRNSVASKEGGEPSHNGNPGGVSVWYRWTAPSGGAFTFNTFGSDFNTVLAVYTGNVVNALTELAGNDDAGASSQSRVTFNATAGTVYYIAVDGSVGVPGSVTAFTGNLSLNWSPESGVSNNNFAQAQTLTGSSGSVASTNAGATKESGEPNHVGDRGGRSVWYSWTAPFSGPALFSTLGSDFDTVLAVYTGSGVNALTLLAANDDSPYADNLAGHVLTSSLSFTATAGTTYKIVVDGSGGRSGNFALRWGPEASLGGQVAFIAGLCGINNNVTVILSGEDSRAVTFSGSGRYNFEHLRAGANYSVRAVLEISANCIPLFLERARNYFPLAGGVTDADFIDDRLRRGSDTSTIAGTVKNSQGLGVGRVGSSVIALTLSGSASGTYYAKDDGKYQMPPLSLGTYTVTPSAPLVTFNPPSRQYTFTSNQNILGADFVVLDAYTIEGQARDSGGAAIPNAIIEMSGSQSASVQTDGEGYYTLRAVAGGSYTVAASKAGLSFTPPLNFPSLAANKKNADFIATSGSTLRIDALSPRAGRASGGQPLTLTGSFTGLASVKIGGVAAAVTISGPGQLIVTTPAHAAGPVAIELVPESGAAYVKEAAFAYLPTVFTDDVLVAGVTTARAQHVIELRQAVDALRAVAGLAQAQWTDPALTPFGPFIKTAHIVELRAYLEEAATQLGYPAALYTDPVLGAGGVVKRVHVEELRQRIRNIAGQ